MAITRSVKEAALFEVGKYEPCPHDTALTTSKGNGTTWHKCDDCGKTVCRAHVITAQEASQRFRMALDTLANNIGEEADAAFENAQIEQACKADGGADPYTSPVEPRYLWEILVPTQSNSGKPVRTRQHKEWDSRVRRIAGGLTIFRPAKGKWDYKGNLFAERMIPVRIMCTPNEIQQIADITAKFYNQLAIMFYKVTEVVVVKHYREEEEDGRKESEASAGIS